MDEYLDIIEWEVTHEDPAVASSAKTLLEIFTQSDAFKDALALQLVEACPVCDA